MFLQNLNLLLKRKAKNSVPPWIDLDAASTTPIYEEVLRAMGPYYSEIYFNPNSVHAAGQLAARALTYNRQIVADYFAVRSQEILFASSATEANNWIIESCSRIKLPTQKKPHIIYSAIEHDSVIAPILRLKNEGVITTTILPVGQNGLVDIGTLEKALTKETVLVSIMAVNNEIGSLEPLLSIGQSLAKFKNQQKTLYPYFHSDAAQGLNYFHWPDLKYLDCLTFSGHKINGPKGIGGLAIFNSQMLKTIVPLIVGGHQEFNLRAGTENLPAIIGLAKALEILKQNSASDHERLFRLRSLFWETLQEYHSHILLNGDLNASVPSIINCYFPGILASDMVAGLSEKGVLASPGAACSASLGTPSHVIYALYHDKERAQESVRFSFGRSLDYDNVKHAAQLTAGLYTQLLSLKNTL